MENRKNVLLIAGGGTLGTYVAEELLRLGHCVDVVCLEDKTSNHERLNFYKAHVTLEYLESLFARKYYHGIVNFIHYPEVEDYIPYHKLLTEHTDHLIFLSSYRIYADKQIPITEEAPMLLDVIDDPFFQNDEKYALSKARCERYIRKCDCKKNWTFVRPVISFSQYRLDMIMHTGHKVLDAMRSGEVLEVPVEAKNFVAGLDWSGNTGKMIANLLFKKQCIGEAYTITSAQGLTWRQVADAYSEVLGISFRWVPADYAPDNWTWKFDRAFNRDVDNSKVLKATGLSPADFKSIKEGIEIECRKLGVI